MQRPQILSEVLDEPDFDVVFIGGGATGLGAALDAASRGYRVLLLEANDFCKGTSSRSTKLIHGGVRYLRSGQVAMVRESLLERERLFRNAPELVQPIQFVIPCSNLFERWFYWIGLKIYDFLAGRDSLAKSGSVDRESLIQLFPGVLNREKAVSHTGGVQFVDGQFDDARLAIALAAKVVDCGGKILNYAPVTAIRKEAGKCCGVQFEDREGGDLIDVSAKIVVNAAGVFSEAVQRLDEPQPPADAPRIAPSRGTHIVLAKSFFPYERALVIPKTSDGRILFCIPWYDRCLVGTTDVLCDAIDDDPRASDDEIDYLLKHVSAYLDREPTRKDVLSVFSGIRPLVGKASLGKKGTSGLSREHEIYVSNSGLISVIGGKWTTYRKMGEDVIDLVEKRLGIAHRPSRTARMPLTDRVAGAEQHIDACGGFTQNGIDELLEENQTWRRNIVEGLPYQMVHAVWSIRNEMARCVDDVLARRTRILLLDAQGAFDAAKSIAELLALELGHDDAWVESETRQFRELAKRYGASE